MFLFQTLKTFSQFLQINVQSKIQIIILKKKEEINILQLGYEYFY